MLIDVTGLHPEAGRFELFVQPQVALADGRINGVEALGRLRTAAGAVQLPHEFLPLLPGGWSEPSYRTFVCSEAIRLAGAMRERFGAALAPTVWVNLAPGCLADPTWIDRLLLPLLHDHSLDAAAIGFEVTEAYIDGDLASAIDILRRLRDLGAEVALDDFGTGYSSLTHLRRLPATVVKIDKSFVDMIDGRLRDSSIIGGLTDFVHTLGMGVVAEGVQTEWQALTLSQLGVDAAQGHWFGRAVAPEELTIEPWCGQRPVPQPSALVRRADVWAHQFQLSSNAVAANSLGPDAVSRVVDVSGDLIVSLDDAGTITFANGAAWRLLRRTSRSLLGTSAFDYIHADDLEHVMNAFVRELTAPGPADGSPQEVVHFRLSAADGGWLDVEAIGTGLFDGTRPVGLLVNIRDARDRQAALAQAKASEERLHAFVESSGEIVAVLAADGQIRDCSTRVTKILGFATTDVVGRNFADLIHPDDVHEALMQWSGALNGTNERPALLRILDARGEFRFCEVVSSKGLSSVAGGVVVTVRDVHDRVRMEHELRRLGALDRLALRVARRALALPSATFLAQLPALLEDVSRDIGLEVLVEASDAGLPASDADAGPAISIPIGPEGSFGWLVASSADGSPLHRFDRTVLHNIAHTVGQVLERHRAEEERRASEKLYRILADGAADIVVLCDPEGIVEYASPSVERVLGLKVAEAIGTDLITHLHGDDHERVANAIEDLRRGRTVEMEVRVLTADGSVRWLSGRARPSLSYGALTEINISAFDVTDRRRLQEQLERLAYHDSLTDLGNRSLLERHLERRPADEPLAIALIDLDGFKGVNDTFGHVAGDVVLRAAADHLRAILAPGDVPIRFGGDEFLVLLSDASSDRLTAFTDDLRAAPIRARVELTDVTCGASVGGAIGTVGDFDRLLRSADAALYVSKGRTPARAMASVQRAVG